MNEEKVIAFAKENGYDDVFFLGKWREYDAYEPIFEGTSEENPAFIGPPLLILVKDEEIRMSTEDEAFQQMDEADIDEIDEL